MNDPFTNLIIELAVHLRVPPSTAAMLVPILIMIFNRLARVIPDTATGPLRYIRLVCMVLGMHVKDNSGVPATIDATGAVTRRDTIEDTPEEIEVDASVDEPLPVPNAFTGIKIHEG